MNQLNNGFTIERFIIEQQKKYPQARGILSSVLYDIAFAAKVISREVNKAGLVDILGYLGSRNIQGEEVKKLDVFAQNCIINAMAHTGRLAAMISEETEGIIEIPEGYDVGPYILFFDPLDGSSNIDVNVSIGTIFAIFKKQNFDGKRANIKDCLQPGRNIVAAGYVIYGSSTMLVYSTGQGVHGFTLDPSIGEFLLSHENIKIPPKCKYYSVNEAYYNLWPEPIKELINSLKPKSEGEKGKSSLRYIGSLVADFHRNLLEGGIFLYPPSKKNPQGKLRLMYEAIPLAFIAKQAGGYATNGIQDILSIHPTNLHQRTPLYIGNKEEVIKIEQILRKFKNEFFIKD